jgi:hypothetical protein
MARGSEGARERGRDREGEGGRGREREGEGDRVPGLQGRDVVGNGGVVLRVGDGHVGPQGDGFVDLAALRSDSREMGAVCARWQGHTRPFQLSEIGAPWIQRLRPCLPEPDPADIVT